MGSADGVDEALRAAAEAWYRSNNPAETGEAYAKWSVPGGYTVRGGALGGPNVEFVVWVAAAAASGVLGNAAYDGLKSLVVKARRMRTAASPRAYQPILSRDDAMLLAGLAMRLARLHEGLDGAGSVEVTDAVWVSNGDSGEWQIRARDGHRVLRFAVPDRRPEDALVFGRTDPAS